MAYPATSFSSAVDLTITAANQLHEVINGDSLSTVIVETGEIPSLRKALVDNFYFISPIDWDLGNDETVFNQSRTFTDGSVWWAPTATSTNPVTMTADPYVDSNWRLSPFGVKDYGNVSGNPFVEVKHRRGTNVEIAAGTPAIGELWYNTTDNTIHMGDGVTQGGIKQTQVINVKNFGAKGDGVTDDSAAVSAAMQSAIDNDRVLDFGSGEYLITQELTFTVTSKRLRMTAVSAVLKYSPAAHTQNFFTINTNQATVDIGRGIEFDGQQNANVVVYINSLDDVESLDEASNVYFKGVVRNAYRIIDFARGAGLHISGGFSNVFFDGAAYNCRAAVGAIITGSQAIRGVLVGSNGANQYPISVVFGDNSVISGVGSDDLTINNDQDGIYVATPVQSNIDTTLVVSGGATFRGCRGRSIKAKVDNAVVSGLYIIDEGDNGGTVQSVIDLQYGGSYKDCVVRCKGVAPGSIFASGGLEYPSTVRATEVLIKDCYVWSDVPLTTIITSFPRGNYVGDVKIRDVSVRAEVSRFFEANLNNGDRKDSVSGVTIDNLTGELIRCLASGGVSPYKGVFTISDCTNKTPASAPLVIRSGISGQSADGWANAENMDGFAPSTSAFRRLSGAGEEVPYGKSMSPMLAQRTIDGVVNLSSDSGAFFGETTSLTENQEFTLTSRGRGTNPQGLYFLTVANISGAGLMDFVFITGTSITSLGGGAIGSDFAYGAGSDPVVNAKINVWVDAATGSLKVTSRQSGTTRQLTIWSMT